MTAGNGPFRDQQGNPLSQEALLEQMSEAILANVLACEAAGIPRTEIQMVVGPDGGTVVGDGMVFQTPVSARLSEANGRLLFAAFEQLLAAYDNSQLAEERLTRIRTAHNVERKAQAIERAR